MRAPVLALLAAGLMIGAKAPADDAAKKDQERLQGKWIMESLEIDGQVTPPDKLKDTTLVIKGDRYIIRTGSQSHEASFKLDPGQDPKAIDLTFLDGPNKDKVGKGIYQFEGDTFKLCRAFEGGRDRPTQFGTWPNTGVYLVVWKRQSP
jgi:uncharacterized protein (TIGR03067 family)